VTDYVSCPACKGQGVIEIDETDHPGLGELRTAAKAGDRKAKKMLAMLELAIAKKKIVQQAGS